jgi:hypothetical protein
MQSPDKKRNAGGGFLVLVSHFFDGRRSVLELAFSLVSIGCGADRSVPHRPAQDLIPREACKCVHVARETMARNIGVTGCQSWDPIAIKNAVFFLGQRTKRKVFR